MNKTKLNIQSIFYSIDGEVNGFYGAGQLCTFIRLKGCSLNCLYCDTLYSQNPRPENWMTIEGIVQYIKFSKVTITGGEPLIQKDAVKDLCAHLAAKYCDISIETNGTIVPEFFWERVRYIVDWKLPSSGVEDKMNLEAFSCLRREDVIKFVISDWNDYNRAIELMDNNPSWIARKAFSPTMTLVNGKHFPPRYKMDWPRQLLEKMIEDKVDAQFSLQLHKIIWPRTKGER